MSTQKRKCRLSNISKRQDIDLRLYRDEIIHTINETLPGKNPEVYSDCFTTDPLNIGESIKLGRALAKIEGLSAYGKEVTIFRLFDGETVDLDDTPPSPPKGGRML